MRREILEALRGGSPRRVPWTIHHELLPRGALERKLRSRGLAIAEKGIRPYQEGHLRVSLEERCGWEGEVKRTERIWHTPLGDLESRLRLGPDGSLWTERFPVKSPGDFRMLEYLNEDTEYRSNDQVVEAAQRALGEDGVVLCRMMRSPLQRLLTEWMGIESFSYALQDFPQPLERLLDSLGRKDLEALRIAARSPAEIVWSAENVTADLTGPNLFQRFLRPYYEQAGSILRSAGKLYGVHLDGRLRRLAEQIGGCPLDFVEGFTPPPMGDLQLEEARDAWPGKALWVNVPGTVFLYERVQAIEELRGLIERGMACGGFLLTLTEEFPEPERSLLWVAEAVAGYERDRAAKKT